MSKVAISGNASGTGTFTIAAPNSNSDRTLTLPDEAGTVLTSASNLNSSKLTGAVTVDGSGNVGVNNTSPAVLSSTTQVAIKANASADSMFVAQNSNGLTTAKFGFQFTGSVDNPVIGSYTNHPFLFLTNNTERMRIDSSGNLLVGGTSPSIATKVGIIGGSATTRLLNCQVSHTTAFGAVGFDNGNGTVGSISMYSNSVTYNTSSDYRLKENIAPMTGALATVQQLNPVTYNWKTDGSAGQGFIAHELQAVVPDCVTGEKDAVETYVDEEGVEQTRPVYQGIDTSFLVATLTAAIKELSAKNDALEARIAALEGAANVPT